MKNGVKNGKSTRFSKVNQPSPKAKSKGWDKRRLAQSFMDKVFEMQDMTIAEFEKMEISMTLGSGGFTMRDLMAKNYTERLTRSDKLMLDWLDRFIGKPIDNKDIDQVTNSISHVKVNVINEHRPPEEMEKD